MKSPGVEMGQTASDQNETGSSVGGSVVKGVKTYLSSLKSLRPLAKLITYFRCKFFDWRRGVDTGGLTLVQIGGQPHVQYAATHPKTIAEVLRHLEIEHPKYVFIDFGSGKGRVLLAACEYPFAKILGIELDGELHEIAVTNIRSYRSKTQKCHDVQSIHCDAREYEIPPEPAVLFFFNPFSQDVMSSVLQKLEKSLEEHPREIIIINLGSRLEPLVMQLRGIQLIRPLRHVTVCRIPHPRPDQA